MFKMSQQQLKIINAFISRMGKFGNGAMFWSKKIGYSNIIFFGLLSWAIVANIQDKYKNQPYYGMRFFKRVQPTKFVYDRPYQFSKMSEKPLTDIYWYKNKEKQLEQIE